MKSQILQLLELKRLYQKALCGEKYSDMKNHYPTNTARNFNGYNELESSIKSCSLCNRIKQDSAPSVGILNPNADICFISEVPLCMPNGEFIKNKSAAMLQNIISNIFKTNKYSLLSLVKCDSINQQALKSDILACIAYLNAQMNFINPKIFVLLGQNVWHFLLGVEANNYKHNIYTHNNKNYLLTYSLHELVFNPSLKITAKNSYMIAKNFIDESLKK